MDNINSMLPYEEVIASNSQWQYAFNQGEYTLCAKSYHDDAVLVITNGASYRGYEEIRGFWKEIVESGAKEVSYNNIILKVLDSENVTLTADWSMNKYKGKVVLEKWRKQKNQEWLLVYDEIYIDT